MASAANGSLQVAPAPDGAAGAASNESTTGSQHVDGSGISGAPSSAAVAMGARTDSQDIAAAADLIATLSRRVPTRLADVQHQAQQSPSVAPPSLDAGAALAPPWVGMLPAPDARVTSGGGHAAVAAAAVKPHALARDRSPYARRGGHIPLGDRPPPKPASSVKFSRRNAPYVCQVLPPASLCRSAVS